MDTIGEGISRVRNLLKAVKQDPFVTDRLIYSIILKYAKTLIKREDDKNKILRMTSLFRRMPCVDLIESSTIEACCLDIDTGCKIKRTKDKLPNIFEGAYGPLFRMIGPIDMSDEVIITDPSTYASMTNTTTWKYNKTKYAWFIDGYLFFPELEWEAVSIDALFEDNLSLLGNCSEEYQCLPRQEQPMPIPSYFFSDIEEFIKKDFGFSAQLPGDQSTNKDNVLR